MKKARIILTCVALLAIVGGALAFKAGKFSKGPRAYSWTNLTSSTVGQFVYTAAGSFCVTPAANIRINTVDGSGVAVTTYSTTTPLNITLTHVPGGETIVRPFPGCQLIQETYTTNDL